VLAAALLLAIPAAAGAQEAGAHDAGGFEGFLIEVPVGLAIPISEAAWQDTADPSFVTGATIGYMFTLGGWSAALGPEVEVTYSPVNVEDKAWGHGGQDNVYVGRLRVTGGARFVLGFGSAYMFGRIGVGLDYAHASWDNPPVGNANDDFNDSDAAPALLLAVGMGYLVTDWLGVTVQLELPTGFHDNPTNLPVKLDGDMLDLLTTAAVTFLL
jgi:hypothetical protein